MRISDWSSDVCSSDLHGEQVPHRTRRTIPTRRRDADRHRGRDRLPRRRSCQEQYEMNYSEFQPGLKARAATAALAVTTAFTVISRSEEHTSELQSLMRISYAVFCLKKKKYTAK